MAHLVLDWSQAPPPSWRQGVVAIGNFDGFHRGHQALVAEAARQARAVRVPAVVLSFEPHPLQILRPAQFQPVLTCCDDRVALAQAGGADHVLLLRSTPDLFHLSAREFFTQVLCERLQVRALVEGANFGFGRNREGNVATLAALCQETGVGFTVVPPVLLNGRPISSSRVRQALLAGSAREAQEQLGRPYRLRGIVGTGQRRGRTLGFPTANLDAALSLVPGDGVYAVGVTAQGGAGWERRTLAPIPRSAKPRKVEVHLLDFAGDLVGQPLAVDFLERIRDTQPFASVDALVAQLHQDVEAARGICKRMMNDK